METSQEDCDICGRKTGGGLFNYITLPDKKIHYKTRN